MKKYLVFVFILLNCLIICGCDELNPKDYVINLYDTLTNETEVYHLQSDSFSVSDLPKKINEEYLHIGWSFSLDTTELLTVNTMYPVTENLTLYTGWEKKIPDYLSMFTISEVGTVYLKADKAITSKEDYVVGSISITGNDYVLPLTDVKIRLRGNSSLNAPKKSYKLKFNEKQDIFGMGKDKEWALVANYYDPSLMRNYYAYHLAKAMGMEYAIESYFVEVFLNENSMGLYLLTETVKTGSNRVDIETDYTSDASEIPFLLELDYKMVSTDDIASNGELDKDYFLLDNKKYNNKIYPIATKYPDDYTTSSITTEQYNYIKQYMNDVYSSVRKGTYVDYIDVNSTIDYFIIQELFLNIDMDYSSVFMYKPLGEKLHYGPLWDFDISSGNCNYVSNYSSSTRMYNVNGGSYIFNNLMTESTFYNAFMKRLTEIGEYILPAMFDSFEINEKILRNHAENDNAIWNTLNTNYWPKPLHLVGISYIEQIIYLEFFLKDHYEWMKENM